MIKECEEKKKRRISFLCVVVGVLQNNFIV